MVKNSCPEVCSEMQWNDFIPKERMDKLKGRRKIIGMECECLRMFFGAVMNQPVTVTSHEFLEL